MIRILHTDGQNVGLLIKMPNFLLRMFCKHPGKRYINAPTLAEVKNGKKREMVCTACNKNLGLR